MQPLYNLDLTIQLSWKLSLIIKQMQKNTKSAGRHAPLLAYDVVFRIFLDNFIGIPTKIFIFWIRHEIYYRLVYTYYK